MIIGNGSRLASLERLAFWDLPELNQPFRGGSALYAPAAAARANLDVPAVVRGFPCGPGCAWPGPSAVDPIEESADLPVQRSKHLALRLVRWIEIAKAPSGFAPTASQGRDFAICVKSL